jgi:hypothetical protein
MKETKHQVAYTPHAAKHNERCALCRHFKPSGLRRRRLSDARGAGAVVLEIVV